MNRIFAQTLLTGPELYARRCRQLCRFDCFMQPNLSELGKERDIVEILVVALISKT